MTGAMTAELRDELAADNTRRLVDPRSVPARFHHLKAMGQSPAHCLAAFQTDRPDSLPMRIGRGGHAMAFGLPSVVYPKVRRSKEWDAFKRAHEGAAILSPKEHAHASSIVAALRNHSIASRLLFAPNAHREETILWSQLGRERRSTPDVRGDDYVAELKTTRCAEPSRFVRDGMFRGYHAQLADQCLAIEAATGRRPRKAYIIAVESAPPYAVQVLELTGRALEKGERLCRLWLEQLLLCEQTGSWPPYSLAIEPFDVPDDDLSLTFGEEETGDPDWAAGAGLGGV